MDMRKHLGEILDAVEAGERIRIERDRRLMAFLVPIEDGRRLSDASDEIRARRLQALEDIVDFAERMRAKYPEADGAPDAATAVRLDRDRDEPAEDS